jgi:hypothetical protein
MNAWKQGKKDGAARETLYNRYFYGYNIIRMYFSAEMAGISKEGPARAMSKQKKKAALSREDEMTGPSSLASTFSGKSGGHCWRDAGCLRDAHAAGGTLLE